MKLSHLLTGAVASLALLAATPALADTHAASETAAPSSTGTGPALWEVSDEDTTIYLFGTFHFLPKEAVWFTPKIAEALAASELVVKELGPESEDPAAVQAGIVTHGLLAQDQSLSTVLTPEQNAALATELAKLKPQLEQIGITPPVVDRLKPWFVFLNLSVAKFAQLGFGAESGVESVIAEKSEGKEWIGLETLDYQFGLFASLTQQDQVDLLMETVESLDEVETILPAMVQHWQTGDVDALAELLNQGFENSKVADLILYQRNANWAEWIDQRMDQPGTVFIAVGAGHLGGERSVQDYLAAKGITVTRVK